MRAAEILNNTDPEELRNIVYRMRQNFDQAQLPPLTVLLAESPTLFPQMGQRDFRALDADGNLRMVMSSNDLFDELGVHAHLVGLNASGGVEVYLNADDGKVYGGGGNVVIDENGIVMANSATSWFNFEDAGGNIGTINIAADPNNDLEIVNIATSPAGTISFFIKDTAAAVRRPLQIREDPSNANVTQWYVSSMSSGWNMDIGGALKLWAHKDGTETVFNDDSYDIDHRWEGSTDPNLFRLDAGLDAAAFGTAPVSGQKLTIDGKTVIASGGLNVTNGNVRSHNSVINDDAVVSFTPSQATGICLVFGGADATAYGIIIYSTATPSVTAYTVGSNLNTTTGALTGTTGTDTKFTVSAHTDGKLYFENRRGGARNTYILLI